MAPIQGVVWNADQGPHQIQGEVTIPIGTTLFIEPGTNVFYDADHVAQIKDGAFMDFVNNTAVQIANAALYFELPGHTQSPGRGANVDGCIFWPAAEPLFDRVSRISQLAVNRSILPSAWHGLGVDNIDADPLFVDPNADWRVLDGGWQLRSNQRRGLMARH